jgi:hypothetical protein
MRSMSDIRRDLQAFIADHEDRHHEGQSCLTARLLAVLLLADAIGVKASLTTMTAPDLLETLLSGRVDCPTSRAKPSAN